MGIKNNLNKWIVFLMAFFIATVFNSYEAQAETNSNGESKEVAEVESTKDSKDLYMSKEDVEQLLKESSQEYELKLLEYKLEAQTEKNGVLQGNIGTILSLLAIIIAVIVAILGLVWKWFESRVKTNISSSLQNIQSIETKIDGINTEIKSRHKEINESYKKIKDLEEDVQKSNINYKNFNQEKIELNNSIDGIKQYAQYLEARCQEVEWANKFVAQKETRGHIINELEVLFEEHLTAQIEQTVIIKFTRKHRSNITDDDSKLSNIYDYYVKCMREEEDSCLKEIKSLGDFNYTDYLETIEEDGNYESEIESKYNDWDGYMSHLEDMLEMVNAVMAMNAVRS